MRLFIPIVLFMVCSVFDMGLLCDCSPLFCLYILFFDMGLLCNFLCASVWFYLLSHALSSLKFFQSGDGPMWHSDSRTRFAFLLALLSTSPPFGYYMTLYFSSRDGKLILGVPYSLFSWVLRILVLPFLRRQSQFYGCPTHLSSGLYAPTLLSFLFL